DEAALEPAQLRADPAAFRVDPRARGRLEVLAELRCLLAREREPDRALLDRGDLLCRHVPRLAEDARRHRETVEDVAVLVACDLVHASELGSVRGYDLPAGANQEPRHG